MLNPKVLLSNEGRVNRLTWWIWCILLPIILLIITQLLSYLPQNGILVQIIGIVILCIGFIEIIIIIVASVKRLHDIDKSGFYLILAIIPIIDWVLLYYLGFKKGIIGANKFGEDPSKDRQLLSVKKCPYCAEIIKYEAVICRYCGRELPTIGNEDKSLNVSRSLVKESSHENNQINNEDKQPRLVQERQQNIKQIESSIQLLNKEERNVNIQILLKSYPPLTAIISLIIISLCIIPFVPSNYLSVILIIIIALIISAVVMIIMRNSFHNENIKPIILDLEQKKNRIQSLNKEREKLIK